MYICVVFDSAVVSDKVALVIGNQNYECQMLQGLAYPEKDAYDVAFALQRLEFKVGREGVITKVDFRDPLLSNGQKVIFSN